MRCALSYSNFPVPILYEMHIVLTRNAPSRHVPFRPFDVSILFVTEQGVKWIVMTDTTMLGLGQLTTFRAAVGSHLMVRKRWIDKRRMLYTRVADASISSFFEGGAPLCGGALYFPRPNSSSLRIPGAEQQCSQTRGTVPWLANANNSANSL